MDSQVLYRKWRPQTLSEVAGQEHVTRTLKNALERGRVSHAYLFCGPRGTGKTSTGRILAKAVNCLTSGGRGEPCNACAACHSITAGSALDVIEIDAASNRGIDEMRNLREKVNFAPNMARFKVYIVDEVHMLTDAAANALLKTLEEPPPYVVFVLATTEPHRLLPTILSRCQRYDFRRLAQASIVARLSGICAGEQDEVEPEALGLIARSSTGSLRDAVNLLEQVVTHYGRKVSLPQVQALLGISGDRRARELASHIMNGDTAAALQTLNAVVRDGLDLRQFHRELLDYLRQLLLVKCGSTGAVDAGKDDILEMQAMVAGASVEHVLKAVKAVGRVDLRLDSYASLPLEVAVVECGVTERTPTAPQKPRQVTHAPQPAAPVAETRPRPAAPPAQPVKVVPVPPARPEPQLAPAVEKAVREAPAPAGPAAAPSPAGENPLGNGWDKVVNLVRGVNKNIALRLEDARCLSVKDGTAVLLFSHDFHMKKILEPECRRLVEDSLSKVTGTPLKISCELQAQEKKPQQAGPQGHLVKAALQLGAKIVNPEEQQ